MNHKIETLGLWIRKTAVDAEALVAAKDTPSEDWLKSGATGVRSSWRFRSQVEAEALVIRWDAFVEVWELLTDSKWPDPRPDLRT